MAMASAFWLETLRDYEMNRPLALPFDRHRLSDEQRTGRGTSASFDFGEDLSRAFLAYATMSNTTPELLSLACYFAFLFKLTNGERDLCLTMETHARYNEQLHSIIGMFLTLLPCRIQLDPSLSFEHLVAQVRHLYFSILEHSLYPLQRIIGTHQAPAFLDTRFHFITVAEDVEHLKLDGTLLQSQAFAKDDHLTNFDMLLTFVHNPSTGMSCSLICSQDLFDQTTVQTLADRFSCLLHRLFDSTATSVTKQSLCQLSIILPKEEPLIHSLKHNGISRLQAPYSTIIELFNQQALSQPQKLSVELDEQSLTYSELFFYAQQLALLLIDGHDVKAGDIVCQCVERSLSMVRLMRTTSLL